MAETKEPKEPKVVRAWTDPEQEKAEKAANRAEAKARTDGPFREGQWAGRPILQCNYCDETVVARGEGDAADRETAGAEMLAHIRSSHGALIAETVEV